MTYATECLYKMLWIGIAFIFIFAVTPLNAAICYVSPNGNANITDCTNAADPCRGFKFAIESAVPECTEVNAFSGSYNGTDNKNIAATLPLIVRGIESGVEVNLEGAGRFFQIQQTSSDVTNFTLVVKNIAIRNGFRSASAAAILVDITDVGSGIGSAPLALFDNVTLTDNRVVASSAFGGAMRIIGLGVLIRNSVISRNSLRCNDGGGAFCYGGALRLQRTSNSVARYIIEDSRFEFNELRSLESSATAISYGGAIALGGTATNLATLTLRRCSFIGNRLLSLGTAGAQSRGGAVAGFGANVSIELSTFHSNRLFSAATTGFTQLVIGGAVSVFPNAASPVDTTELYVNGSNFYNNSVSCANSAACANQLGGGAVSSSRVFTSGSTYCNNSVEGGSGAHIFVVSSVDTETLQAGPFQNVFTCNTSGPAIQPLSFECGSPECVYPSAVVDPATQLCVPCVQLSQFTPTGIVTQLLSLSSSVHIQGC